MKLPDPMWLGLLYAASELWLGITHRSRGNAVSRDKKSLRILWIVILASVFFGIQVAYWFPSAAMPHRASLRITGFFIFVFGLVLRWYSIGYLGRFFTVDVAIHSGHRVIESGPYRFIRHRSYTGALLAFLGLGLSMGNWCSVAIFTLPTFLVFLLRIEVEERAPSLKRWASNTVPTSDTQSASFRSFIEMQVGVVHRTARALQLTTRSEGD